MSKIADRRRLRDLRKFENTNVLFGFDDLVPWQKKNPGRVWYSCKYCGLYQASCPRCNKCEESRS